jgi:hypothetical protein
MRLFYLTHLHLHLTTTGAVGHPTEVLRSGMGIFVAPGMGIPVPLSDPNGGEAPTGIPQLHGPTFVATQNRFSIGGKAARIHVGVRVDDLLELARGCCPKPQGGVIRAADDGEASGRKGARYHHVGVPVEGLKEPPPW